MMTSLKQFAQKDLFRSLALALIIIGLALSIFSAVRYVDLSFRIAGNASFLVRQSGGQAALQTETDARMLMAADLQLTDLENDRSMVLISGGAGLVILALGWIGYDMSRPRKIVPIMPQQSTIG